MEVRPACPADLEACLALDHSYVTDHVWQMEAREENGVVAVTFRPQRLPRAVRVNYPRQEEALLAGWRRRDGFLVAETGEQIRGYVALTLQPEHQTGWVGDLVVDRRWRRQGVGTALLRAAGAWGREQGLQRLVLAVQTKNYPAIRFCQSRGLTFCGYHDHYWPGQEIALFFGQTLRSAVSC